MSARHVKIRDGLELTTAKKVDEKKLHGLVEDLAGALSKTTPTVSQVASPMDALYYAACHEKRIELYCDNMVICKHLINRRKWSWSQIKK